MSIFGKPLTQLTSDDLSELIAESAVENLRLEFKRKFPEKDETLKKLSAFANTFGGYVVVGAEENGKDGKIVALPGVEIRPGYRQTLVQWCFSDVWPPLTIEVSDPIPTPGDTGRVCYVLHVGESDQGPHFLSGRKGVYVRTDEFSSRFDAQLANDRELRHLFDRRGSIRARRSALIGRARERFQSFVGQKGDYDGLPWAGSLARFDLTMLPRFPSQPVCDRDDLMGMIKSAEIDWRGSSFPRTSDLIFQHESVIALNAGAAGKYSTLEANTWGQLTFASEIEEPHESKKAIHAFQFLGQVMAFIRFASFIFPRFQYGGPLWIEMRMMNMRGVRWLDFDLHRPDLRAGSQLDDSIGFYVECSTDALTKAADALALDILRTVLFATNWRELSEASREDEILQRASKYNRW